MPNIEDLIRGDLIGIDWVDIQEDVTSDANDAALARRHSIGFFWESKEDKGIPVIVTTTTLDEELEGQQGYCCYPRACVVKVKIIKAKRRKRTKKEENVTIKRRVLEAKSGEGETIPAEEREDSSTGSSEPGPRGQE